MVNKPPKRLMVRMDDLRAAIGSFALYRPPEGWSPINLYARGPLPSVGEVVREDGLIYVLRRNCRAFNSIPDFMEDSLFYGYAGHLVVA